MPRQKPFPKLTDAEIARARQIVESLPVPVRIAWSREGHVQACLRHRQHIKHGAPNPRVTREDSIQFLRFSQKALLKLRIWRTTGHYPSDDN